MISSFTRSEVDLFIGRKRTRITEPVRFESQVEVAETTYHDLPVHVPVSQSYRLFINEKLFASVRAFPKGRYSRAPIRVVKPRRGPLQIHFVKKYTTLYE
jgi:hypothetical protein